MNLEDTRRIPPPDPEREPLKVNVYERMAKAAAQLMPRSEEHSLNSSHRR